ncbi:MAG: hypothetical protein ACK5KT_15425 [Dysgonomonas sp.]
MKTKRSKHLTLYLSLLLLLFSQSGTISAQVTIGSGLPPTRAALLELKTEQTAGATTVGDDKNITSKSGGFLLPRVKLESTITLAPFIPTSDPDWDGGIKQKDLSLSLAGLMVYNIATVGTSLYPGLYTWDGLQWSTSQANPSKMEIARQPEPFTFYETGVESVVPLTILVSGATGVTYKWFQVTGNNVHIRVGTEVGKPGTVSGSGFTTDSFTPTGVIKGTTLNANNTGFYKFYCEIEDSYGKVIQSDIAEVAVGCGAKNNQGEWLSFMCFNLGATKLTIADQLSHSMTISPANDADGKHYYIDKEENLYGDLYQWGRIGDGHEKRGAAQGFTPGTNTAGTNQVAYTSGTGPTFEDGNLIGPIQHYPWRQVQRGTAHYGNFIFTGTAQNYNWAFGLIPNQIDKLWQNGRYDANDPCAKIKDNGLDYETYYPVQDGIAGSNTNWRMPSSDEWGSLYKGGSISGSPSTATANTWKWNSTNGRGSEIRPDGVTTTLFLPAGGFRNAGNALLYHQGGSGCYWSSGIVGAQAYRLNLNSGRVSPADIIGRGNGLALRCIKNN